MAFFLLKLPKSIIFLLRKTTTMRKISFLLFLSLISTPFFAQNAKIHPSVWAEFEDKAKVECLLLLKDQADLSTAKDFNTQQEKGQYVFQKLKAVAQASQTEVLEFLENEQADHLSFYIANAIWVEADQDLLSQLAERKEILKILPNQAIQAHFPQAAASPKSNADVEWGIERIQAQKLWELGIRGEGVVVGGQDTGYEWDHPAITDQYRGRTPNGVDHNYSWHDAIHGVHPLNSDSLNPCGFDSPVPCDDHSHGTHTVGTMVGGAATEGSNAKIGVAPEAQWVGCRNMERGWGAPASYIECFEWFLAPTDLNNMNPDPSKAPQVIANSWGCPTYEGCVPENFEVMELAVNNLRAAGVVIVVSAGNDGPGCSSVRNPASIFEASFAVGASTPADTMANFSSRGPVTSDGSGRLKPNVVAPGTQVRSCIRGGGYASWSGTSMAGPHVAGAVAMLISAEPSLAGNVDLIEEILMQSAMPIYTDQSCGDISGRVHPNHTAGWGRIDLMKALAIVRPDLINNEAPNQYKARIFPNPSSGIFLVVLPEDIGENNIRVFNALGQEVATFNKNFNRTQQIDLSDLPNGIYMMVIEPTAEPKKRFSMKLLKRSNP
jgi:serine protease AprX